MATTTSIPQHKSGSFCARFAFAILAAFSLASCSDAPDGKWDPIVWEAEVPVQMTEGVYTGIVAGTGAWVCDNYSDSNPHGYPFHY